MPINLGSKSVPDIFLGSKRVEKVYLGSTLKYQYSYVPPEPPGYHLYNGSATSSSATLKVESATDKVTVTCSSGKNTTLYGNIGGKGSFSWNTSRPTVDTTWFKVRSGDVVKLVLTSAGTNSGSGTINLGWVDTGESSLTKTLASGRTPSNICSTYTLTVTEAHDISQLMFSCAFSNKRACNMCFTLKLYVNDILYIGY